MNANDLSNDPGASSSAPAPGATGVVGGTVDPDRLLDTNQSGHNRTVTFRLNVGGELVDVSPTSPLYPHETKKKRGLRRRPSTSSRSGSRQSESSNASPTTLDCELNRYRRMLETMQRRPDRPPADMVAYFSKTLQFLSDQVEEGYRGNLLAEKLLDALQPISTLEEQWKLLLQHVQHTEGGSVQTDITDESSNDSLSVNSELFQQPLPPIIHPSGLPDIPNLDGSSVVLRDSDRFFVSSEPHSSDDLQGVLPVQGNPANVHGSAERKRGQSSERAHMDRTHDTELDDSGLDTEQDNAELQRATFWKRLTSNHFDTWHDSTEDESGLKDDFVFQETVRLYTIVTELIQKSLLHDKERADLERIQQVLWALKETSGVDLYNYTAHLHQLVQAIMSKCHAGDEALGELSRIEQVLKSQKEDMQKERKLKLAKFPRAWIMTENLQGRLHEQTVKMCETLDALIEDEATEKDVRTWLKKSLQLMQRQTDDLRK